MKTSTMVQEIVDFVECSNVEDLIDFYNYLFPKADITIADVEVDE